MGFLVEMGEDPSFAAYLSRLKQQIAVAMLKWRLCWLSLLALKLSNAAPSQSGCRS
jgi:hypothetical protein